MQDGALSELSGLVASANTPGLLWSINDSGSLPRLFRIDEQGRALGRVWVFGAWLHDTEALATWRERRAHWLLLGDVGDNRARRDSVVVHAVEEPKAGQRTTRIAWSLRIRFPDGPRDVEGIAVDGSVGDLLLVSKRDLPPRFYRVPLAARHSSSIATAAFIGSPLAGAVDGAATGLDIDPAGRDLVLLTYTRLYLWRRLADEPWAEVLQRAPLSIDRPQLQKAEAMALSSQSGRVLVGSERQPTPLWSGRYDGAPQGGAGSEASRSPAKPN